MDFFCVAIGFGLISGCIFYFRRGFAHGFEQVSRMHQVPCTNCAYFTGDYNLKCAVNPCHAMTEAALGCRDFEPAPQVAILPCPRSRGKILPGILEQGPSRDILANI